MSSVICLLMISVVLRCYGDQVNSTEPLAIADDRNLSSFEADQLHAFADAYADIKATCIGTSKKHPFPIDTIYIGDKFGGFNQMIQPGSKIFAPCRPELLKLETGKSWKSNPVKCSNIGDCRTFYEVEFPFMSDYFLSFEMRHPTNKTGVETYFARLQYRLCDDAICRTACLGSDYCAIDMTTGKTICEAAAVCTTLGKTQTTKNTSAATSSYLYYKTCPANKVTICSALAKGAKKLVYSYYYNTSCEEREDDVVRFQYQGRNVLFAESVPIYGTSISIDIVCTTGSHFNAARGTCFLRDTNETVNIERKVDCFSLFTLTFDTSEIPDGPLELGLRCMLRLFNGSVSLSANFLVFNLSVSVDAHPDISSSGARSYRCKVAEAVSTPFYIKEYQWTADDKVLKNENRTILYSTETGVIDCGVLLAVASCGSGLSFRSERLITSKSVEETTDLSLIYLAGGGGALLLIIVIVVCCACRQKIQNIKKRGRDKFKLEVPDEEMDAMLWKQIEARREAMFKEAKSRPAKTREQMLAEYNRTMRDYEKNKKTR